MADAYRALSEVPSVQLVNNSLAGAMDYAAWLGIPVDKYIVKRNGIDENKFKKASPTACAELRSRLGIPNGAFLVGGMFRLYEEKRPFLWVEAAALVAAKRHDVHFVIFGVGPLQEEVNNAVSRGGLSERFHLPGTMTDAALAISSMDVFVLTSMFEGLPNVVLEAQLLGVPVVATEAGGTREAIDIGKTGWLISEAKPDLIADRILAVLQDHEWRRAASAAGPEFIQERFGLKRMIDETVALYGSGI